MVPIEIGHQDPSTPCRFLNRVTPYLQISLPSSTTPSGATGGARSSTSKTRTPYLVRCWLCSFWRQAWREDFARTHHIFHTHARTPLCITPLSFSLWLFSMLWHKCNTCFRAAQLRTSIAVTYFLARIFCATLAVQSIRSPNAFPNTELRH